MTLEMMRELLQDAEGRMKGAIKSLEEDLATFRTGRANPHLVDRVIVEMYGVEMPLPQMAVISVPEPQQIAIRPYDGNAIGAIERAIMKSDLGLMPNNDGKIIRLNIPRLTEERRRDLSRLVGKRVEDARVAVRNVRRDVRDDLQEMEREKMISEDQLKRSQDDLDRLTEHYIDKINEIGVQKEKEIMEI
jgi:ribosome recycling factor